MLNYTFCKAGLLVSFLFLANGCATPPQSKALLASPPDITAKHQINNVPFFPQQDFFCGPATLSEVFNYYGVEKDQQSLAAELFVPKLKGSFQIEMVASARQAGFVAYAQEGNLAQLLSLVSEDIPVVVLQNVSTPWYPMWHYAVVTGYDLKKQLITLHSGDLANRVAEFSVFERTWARGKYWLLAALPPTKASQYLKPFIYTRAAQDLISVGKSSAGITALTQATKQWPDYWLPYFLLGNYFLSHDVKQANFWYQQGYKLATQESAYLNNYAYALNAIGCNQLAKQTIEQALILAPKDANIIDSQQAIYQSKETAQCSMSSVSLH
ncbi:PA2778 family cysteine peptidase [Colwellia sp. BRX8-4]|nr:PA2778 family cysteine peptidase [Colwellia sp. BRX8-8]MBA6371801.1 PA2778 family cysteine peptidase [Colwellia sp. BRX8-4]